jgi:hypothetical protein
MKAVNQSGPPPSPGPATPPTLERLVGSPLRFIVAVALVATVVGAGVGTAVTLLVGDPGPAGPRGEQGKRGPRGPVGPAADTSAVESAIGDLSAQLDDLQAQVDQLSSASTPEDLQNRLDELDSRVSDLESIFGTLCTDLNLPC